MIPENLMGLCMRTVKLTTFRGWRDVKVAARRGWDAWARQEARRGNGICETEVVGFEGFVWARVRRRRMGD